MIDKILSFAMEFEHLTCEKYAEEQLDKSLYQWFGVIDSNVNQLKTAARGGNIEHLEHAIEVLTGNLNAMKTSIRTPEEELDRDRMRRLRILKDKRRLGLF